MKDIARVLIFSGAFLVLAGLVLETVVRLTGRDRLPGDFFYRNGQFSFYFPLATSLLVSVILTVLLNIFKKGNS